MKIFEELKANVNALKEYVDDEYTDNLDAIFFCIGLLEKGYSLNKEIEEFETYNIDEIPRAGTEWIERAQDAIAERIKLAELVAKVSIYLNPPKGVKLLDSYMELKKAAEVKEYDESKIIISDSINPEIDIKEIYKEITK